MTWDAADAINFFCEERLIVAAARQDPFHVAIEWSVFERGSPVTTNEN